MAQQNSDGSRSSQHPRAGNYVGATYRRHAAAPAEQARRRALALSPSPPNIPEVRVDWLRVRLEDTPEVWRHLHQVFGDDWTQREYGWRGWYDVSWSVLETGIIAACSTPDRAAVQGIIVDLSASALARLGDRAAAFMRWSQRHGRVTRCDFCADDRTGRVTIGRVKASWLAGGIVTRWREQTMLERRSCAGQSATFYAGTRQSETLLRVYDKAAQQRLYDGTIWTRVELECHSDTAHELLRQYLDAGGRSVISQLNRRIRFVVPDDTDTNDRRWQTESWWLEFLGDVAPGLPLTHGSLREASVQLMASWLERQCAPTFAAVMLALQEPGGAATKYLRQFLDAGEARLKSKHVAAICAYQADCQQALAAA